MLPVGLENILLINYKNEMEIAPHSLNEVALRPCLSVPGRAGASLIMTVDMKKRCQSVVPRSGDKRRSGKANATDDILLAVSRPPRNSARSGETFQRACAAGIFDSFRAVVR
jgi:hypothetical protein